MSSGVQTDRSPDAAQGGPMPWAALDAAARRFQTPCGAGEMVWRCWGEGGRPLVLLHGGAGSWLHWLRTIPAFAADRMVIVPDIPGLGSSAAPPASTPAAIAGVILEGLEQVLGHDAQDKDRRERFDIAGFSYGGVLAGFLAAQAGARARSLTLVGSGGLGVPIHRVALERVRDKTGAERDAANRTNLLRWMIADPARIDAQALAIQDWNSRHARFDSRPIGSGSLLPDELRKLSIPITGIWGEQDHAVRGLLGEVESTLRAIRPEMAFHRVPAAGHWVAYEAPNAFAAILRAVLGPR